MIGEDERKQIVSNAINAAICIDDGYASPYSGETDNNAEKLYQSFREQGRCALDVYKYSDINAFKHDKDYLLNHKELMILDWELNAETPGKAKYEDALKVLECAVIDKHIRCVTIYTHTTDLAFILLQIYSYFIRVYSDDSINEKINEIVDKTADLLENTYEIDEGLEFLKNLLDQASSGYSLSDETERKKTLKALKKNIQEKVQPEAKRNLRYKINDDLQNVLSCYDKETLSLYEIINNTGINEYKYTSNTNYKVDVYDGQYFLINNTIIFVINKGITDVSNLYGEVTKAISLIPNNRTLLLSLLMRHVLYENIGVGGKGLGMVTDKMLLHHWQSYEIQDIDNLLDFIILCLKEDVAESLKNNINIDFIKNLFTHDENEPEVKADDSFEKELALFNKIITFVDKKDLPNGEHQIKTGDIFKLTSNLYGHYGNDKIKDKRDFSEYLICISQSCDCLRPSSKIHNNFAFAYGTDEVNLHTALQKIEKDNYSIIDEKTVVNWHDNFLTIHIENNVFNKNENFKVKIDGQDKELEYIGNLKDFYAQRIINKVFNNAMRIGVDLPHLKYSKK